MPALQVKDCPTDVYERLRACAAEENRSISQQALTIIEDFLEMRSNTSRPFMHNAGFCEGGEADYASKRRRSFERISKLDPLPISDKAPRTDELLAEIRAEEAR